MKKFYKNQIGFEVSIDVVITFVLMCWKSSAAVTAITTDVDDDNRTDEGSREFLTVTFM